MIVIDRSAELIEQYEQRIATLTAELAAAREQSEAARNLGQRHVDRLDALRAKLRGWADFLDGYDDSQDYMLTIKAMHQAADGGKGEG